MFGREPALWLGLIQSLLALVVGFGVDLTGAQVALIMGFSGAAIAVITRQSVVPTATIRDSGTSPAAIKAQANVNRATEAVEEAMKP